MTDENEDFEIDVNHVQSMLSDELQGIDLHVTEREIGNGPQYAIEYYRSGTSELIDTSYWYNQNEFEAFCSGMKFLERMMREAERERSGE